MKAVRLLEYDGQLVFNDVPTPTIARDEIVVKIKVMTLRFIEQWEYHEIAAAKDMPIGTVQWIVFNAKKKLAPRLTAIDQGVQQERYPSKPERKAA